VFPTNETIGMTSSLSKQARAVITYGTFDLFHVGHYNLLQAARKLGDYLIVGVSTDEFNIVKGKVAFQQFDCRAAQVIACPFVDTIVPEHNWDQKIRDIQAFNASVFVIGSDWEGHFDELDDYVEVVYLPRTPGISSSQIRNKIFSKHISFSERLSTQTVLTF
jgi:glycerol-3-phosphate cytidylyltransferase